MRSVGPPAPDQFDKALTLARELLQQQRSTLEGSYNRFIAVVTTFAVLSAALAGWFGFRTRSDIKQQVSEQVRTEVSADVQQEVAKQFETKNVQATVEQILTREVQTDLDRMVRERATPIVSAQVKALAPEIKRQTESETQAILRDLQPRIEQLAKQEAAIIVQEKLAARQLSPQQEAQIKNQSESLNVKHWLVKLRSLTTIESINYCAQISNALSGAGWLTGSCGVEDLGMLASDSKRPGLFIAVEDPSHPPPHTAELQKVLAAAGIQAPITKGYQNNYSFDGSPGFHPAPNLVVSEK